MIGPGGRFVIFLYHGYQSQQFGTSDRDEAVATIRRLRAEGYRFRNPYTGNAGWWAGINLEIVDTSDPSGQKGEAAAILREALPNAVSIS